MRLSLRLGICIIFFLALQSHPFSKKSSLRFSFLLRCTTPISLNDNSQKDIIETVKRLGLSLTAIVTSGTSVFAKEPILHNVNSLRRSIDGGQVYVIENFISEALALGLRDVVSNFNSKNVFKRSGLSNRALNAQTFGNTDRFVHAVSDEDLRTSDDLRYMKTQIDSLRHYLSQVLNRPSMKLDSLDHELYFSLYKPGSLLPRHLDERHEEIKGKKGWSTPSRRSISWLLYLCEPGWDVAVNGGALRSFPQHLPVIGATGANDGDLQIGWLKVTDKNNLTKDGPRVNISVVDAVTPVFLDCWRRNSPGNVKSALYIRSSTSRQGRQYVSSEFDIRDPVTGKATENFEEFLLSAIDRREKRFWRIEDINAWAAGSDPAGSVRHETTPVCGTLALFDSVSLPHEVLSTLRGDRIALAGWFHESQQVPPKWFTDELV